MAKSSSRAFAIDGKIDIALILTATNQTKLHEKHMLLSTHKEFQKHVFEVGILVLFLDLCFKQVLRLKPLMTA